MKIKKNSLIIVFILNLSALSFSQNRTIDSVYKILKHEKIDTLIINAHISLSYYFGKTELTDSALFHGWLANKIATKNKYNRGVIRSYCELGNTYFDLASYDSCIYCYKNALLNIRDIKIAQYFIATEGIGNSYFYLGDYINAYEYYLKFLQQAEVSGSEKQKAKGNTNVGVILKEQKKHDEALRFFNKTIQIGIANNDFKTMFVGFSNKGNIYYDKAKLNKSDYYTKLALESYIKAKDALLKCDKVNNRSVIVLYGNIGNVYADLKQYDRAIIAFTDAIKLIDENNYFPETALLYTNLTSIYLDVNNLKMAEKYIKVANEISIKSQSVDNLAESYQNYSRYYELKGEYKNAYKSYILYKLYNDSMFNSENTERLKELELKGEFEKKESIKQTQQESKDLTALAEKNKQRVIILAISIVLVVVIILSFFIFNGLKKQRRANQIISKQKEEVHLQKILVEEKHKEITDSINYAERIQRSFLASEELLTENLREHFVFFQPKDVVSGDFYWASKTFSSSGVENFALVTADSTGHGVPGAIMSILNISSLEKAVEQGMCEPSEILNHTRKTIIERLKKDGSTEGGKDGMDCSLISFDFNSPFKGGAQRAGDVVATMTYAAANNPVWVIRKSNLIELSPDKMPVSKHDKDSISFLQHEFHLQSEDMIYTLTDGMPDQFGGPKGKKFKYKQLKEFLTLISELPLDIQEKRLRDELNNWKGYLEQVDDICIIGVKI